MKRGIALVLILTLSNTLVSCVEDNCGGFTSQEASIAELRASIGTVSSEGFSTTLSNDFEIAAIQIIIEEMNYSEIASNIPSLFFDNIVYACSPLEPTPTQTIESINITSEVSVFFDGEEYQSGENLAELFKVSGYLYSNEEITVQDFIGRQKSDLWIFGQQGANVIFQFINKPGSLINQEFSFEFELSDSKRVSVQSSTFEVQN